MANCLVSQAITFDCDYSSSGVTDLWMANRSEIASITYAGTAGRVDTITMVSGKKFYHIDTSKGFCNYEEKGTNPNGTKIVTQTINFQTPSTTEEVKVAYEEMHLANDLVFVIRDANGNRKIFFETSGGEATEVNRMSGTKVDDFSGFSAIVSGTNPGFATELESTLVLTV